MNQCVVGSVLAIAGIGILASSSGGAAALLPPLGAKLLVLAGLYVGALRRRRAPEPAPTEPRLETPLRRLALPGDVVCG